MGLSDAKETVLSELFLSTNYTTTCRNVDGANS